MKKDLEKARISPVVEKVALSTEGDTAWHSLSIEEVAQRLDSDLAIGLSEADAAHRLAHYGPNVLAQARVRSAASILLAQFRSFIVWLLLAAALIAFAMQEPVEGFAILSVIVLNAGIGFLTEWKAEQALTALRQLIVPTAHVIRSSVERQIPSSDLVPGDVVILAVGARIPADGRIVESVRLQIDEAALTGESQAVYKGVTPLPDRDLSLGDRSDMAFLGTTITVGRGKLLVTATGLRTEVGKIGKLVQEATVQATPLERQLSQLGQILVAIVLVLCAVVVVAGWIQGARDFWHMLETGISLAIAAVPEGLPAVATMTLALGMQRMARRGALVRKLAAVETLGSTTVICTDKTGTLTKNEMTACVFTLNGGRIDVTGSGYSPVGTFQKDGQSVTADSDDVLLLALRIGALCNDAKVTRAESHPTILGDPTEAALVVAAEKGGLNLTVLERDYPRLAEVPFDSSNKRMITVHRTPQGATVAYVKGSPGTLLRASSFEHRSSGAVPLLPDDRNRWEKMNHEMARSALRVLGLAYRDLPERHQENDYHELLTFVGLVGMIDPLRDEAKAAIAMCRQAGIRTVMITGDQQPTAAEIAHQLGIDRDARGHSLRIVHARELNGLDAVGWQDVVNSASVFARVSPEHKLKIVEALQQQGNIVGMTGDGVNDAPALKRADIGIAMGIKGTAVAKESAAMVITDDNFATIVDAVEQGRIIYSNILRFIHYLFSCNLSEILTVFVAIMLGWPLPLGALQILWLNLITDVFPALALALEPSAPDVMKRPPRSATEPLISMSLVGLIAAQGVLLAGVTLAAFAIAMHWYGTEGHGLRQATTIAFMTLTLTQIAHVFNARSQSRSAFTSRFFSNGWLWAAVALCLVLQVVAVYVPLFSQVLNVVRPSVADWALIVACSLIPVVVVDLVKLRKRWARQGLVESGR